jgi:hypothetical protein
MTDAGGGLPSFCALLQKHFTRGTRAHLSPTRGEPWSRKEFAEACEVTVRAVGHWLNCKSVPPSEGRYFAKVQTAFFGTEPKKRDRYEEWREEFRKAHERAETLRSLGRAARARLNSSRSEGASTPPPRLKTLERPPWGVAQPLISPRYVSNIRDEFDDPTLRINYGEERFDEVARLLEPLDAEWLPNEISWTAIRQPFEPAEFWKLVDNVSPLGVFLKSDEVSGKHIRLAAASQRRRPEDGHRLDFIWQPVSWHDSVRTNGRIAKNIRFQGAPLWAWFAAKDLLTPPVDGDFAHRDSPLANRFAINLAVILRQKGTEDIALFQERTQDVAASPRRIECGISESVHGGRGWPAEEIDVQRGRPDIERTARRCLWQELGLAERGKLGREVPAFDLSIRFTGLVLNKEELSPRLVGYIEVWGSLEDAERASRASVGLHHREFGRRPDKDAVPWECVKACPATRGAFAAVFRRLRGRVSPECRVRLLYYLKTKHPETWNVPPMIEEPPPWL